MGKVADFRPVIGAALLATVFALVWAATAFDEVLAAGAIWPANALVLAFVLRACRGALTTRLMIAAAVATMAVAYLAAGTRPWLALTLPLAHALEILLAVHLLGPRRAAYSTFGDLRRLVTGAVLVAPLASALAGLPLLLLAGAVEGAPARAAAGWFGAHAFGMAVVAPFALYAAARGAWPIWRAVLVPFVVALLFVMLSLGTPAPVGLLAFPLVMLAVLHDRVRGAALVIGLVAAAMLTLASFELGLVHYLALLGVNPTAWIQVFFGCLVATAYPLAVALKRLDAHAAEAEARRSQAEADSLAKTRLLGEVGEELRSPLSGVVTLAELLRSGRLGELNPRQRELLGRIADAGAEIETLSQDMMQGTMTTPVRRGRRCDPAAAAGDAVRALAFAARRRLVVVETALAPGLGVALDRPRLTRVIEEALAAAIAAAPRGGRVRIGVEGLTDGVRVRVEDDDAGGVAARLTAHQLAKLERAPLHGRAVDRNWLRQHGGDLTVAVGELGGLRVDLLLPAAGQRAAA